MQPAKGCLDNTYGFRTVFSDEEWDRERGREEGMWEERLL